MKTSPHRIMRELMVRLLLVLGLASTPAKSAESSAGTAREVSSAITKNDRDLLTHAIVRAKFIANLARLATERAEKPALRAFAEKVSHEQSDIVDLIAAWSTQRGVDLQAHLTQEADKPGTALGGAGKTDNIGQPRGPGAPATPTEQIPREAAERETTTARGPQPVPADDSAEAREGSDAANVRLKQRQEVRLRKIADRQGVEFDQAFLDVLEEEQRAQIKLCERLGEGGDDPEAQKLAADIRTRYEASQKETEGLR